MNEKDTKAIKTALMNKARGVAQHRAYVRLVAKHREEYQRYYKEECSKLGVNTRTPQEIKTAELIKELREIERKTR